VAVFRDEIRLTQKTAAGYCGRDANKTAPAIELSKQGPPSRSGN